MAKVLATKHSVSSSEPVGEPLKAMLVAEDAYAKAAASAMARVERGLHLGGGKVVSRDALHER